MEKKNIVVLGAGFGGLRTAMLVSKGLAKRKLIDRYAVTLVDRSDCHLFTPLLYKLAADPDVKPECTYDITSLLKGYPVRFLQSEVATLDLMNGDVHFKTGEELKADYLVIATGSETNYFGIPGLKENSLQLKTAEQALAIRSALEKLFGEEGEKRIVVGGAGANGTELSAEIRLWADRAHKEKGKMNATVTVLEATPTVLPGLDPRIQAVTAKRLQMLGVQVMTGAKIVDVAADEVSLDGGKKVPFDLFIWTGGVKSPDLLTQLPLNKEPHGKPLVRTGMECFAATPDLKLYPMVYGLGDSVCFMNPKTNHPVPAVARAAILEADVVTHNILCEIEKTEKMRTTPKPETYVPADYPYVIPIGSNWAVAKIGSSEFSGWPAWAFAKIVEIHYLLSIMPFRDAMQAWGKMH